MSDRRHWAVLSVIPSGIFGNPACGNPRRSCVLSNQVRAQYGSRNPIVPAAGTVNPYLRVNVTPRPVVSTRLLPGVSAGGNDV